MKKLRLELDAIEVETFPTASEVSARGSIVGREETEIADFCTADLDCYTADPRYRDCTGGNPCTGDHRCTAITTCVAESANCD